MFRTKKVGYIKEEKEINPVDQFAALTNQMLETFKVKNNDYGNAFENQLNEDGAVVSKIMLSFKLNRFKTLISGVKRKVSSESLVDTLLDMANYCLLTIMWIQKHSKNE